MSEGSPAGDWKGWSVHSHGQEERVRAFVAALKAAEAGQEGADQALGHVRMRSVLTYTGETLYDRPAFTDSSKGKVGVRLDESAGSLVVGERYYHVPSGEFAGLWLKSAVDTAIEPAEPAAV